MEIEGFELSNTVKLERAKEQLGENADEHAILVAYDKLAGLITKGGQKVKAGCFYNIKTKKAFEKPEVVFIYAVNGRIVEVPEGTELPGEVRAANILAEEAKGVQTKTAKNTKNKKKAVELEDAEEDGE